MGSVATKVTKPFNDQLYKGRATRTQDQADFKLIAPRLGADARAWLRDSLAKTDPGHGWLPLLNDLERA